MIQVQSSWFPLIDLNPQSFVTIRDAKPADFKAATQRIYRWSGQASSLSFSTVE
jgi:predicted acyl esterase